MGGKTAYPGNWIWRFSFERGFDAAEGPGALQLWHYVAAASVCDWNDRGRFLTVTASQISKIVRTYVSQDFFHGNACASFRCYGPSSLWRWLADPALRQTCLPSKTSSFSNEAGFSHALIDVITQQIISGVPNTASHDVEFFTENLELLYTADAPSFSEREDWFVKQYAGHKFRVVVAIGPDTIRFLANHASSLFSDVPIVICGSSLEQAGISNLDARFTGTWQRLQPGRTLDAALRLFPNTRHIFVVGGSSAYDRIAIAVTKGLLNSSQPQTQFSYLVDDGNGEIAPRAEEIYPRIPSCYMSLSSRTPSATSF